MFSTAHIILMILTIGIPVTLAYLMPKLNFTLKSVLLVSMGIAVLSEFIRMAYFVEVSDGMAHVPRWHLPLHLCSIQIIFISVMALTKSESLRNKIISFFIPTALWGGVAAIVVPTILYYHEPMHLLSLNYFIYHGFLIFLALYLYIVRFDSLDKDSYFQCVKITVMLFVGSIFVNSLLYEDRANYFFTAAPPMEGLPLLNLDHGWIMYIFVLIVLGVTLITLTYIPVFKQLRKENFKK